MNPKPTMSIIDKYWQAVVDASAVLHDNSDGAFVVALHLAVDEAYAAGEAAMLRQQLAAVRGEYERVEAKLEGDIDDMRSEIDGLLQLLAANAQAGERRAEASLPAR
jgi:hypothetical protein